MKRIIIILIVAGILSLSALNYDNEVGNAEFKASENKYGEAAEIMKQIIKTYPDSANAYALYGLYLSQQCGQVNFLKAGMLSSKAFDQFEKALELEPENRNARLYRGILSVNVPKFMGKLKIGLDDLEYIKQKYGKIQELYIVASYYLGMGYKKFGDNDKAIENLKFIVLYGKDSNYFEDAQRQFDDLTTSKNDSDENYYQKALNELENQNLNKAVENFRLASKKDPENLELHLLYAKTLGDLAEKGYDHSIKDDVTSRATIAHEVFEILTRCTEIAPENEDIRFLRGSVAVNLPFFVNSLDEGIDDLTFLSENASKSDIRYQANFLLKKAQKTKQVYEMADKGYMASDEERKKMVSQFIPVDNPVNEYQPEGKSFEINLSLGYRDKIAPQTALWIEDSKGNYIETIYVSSFASNVKDRQVHLPKWADKSEFMGVDLVTSASIDCGTHKFYWDYKKSDIDSNINKYKLCAEICHWPHVQYKKIELPFELDDATKESQKESDFLISELSIQLKDKK